jgi:hypothetical protein
MFCQLKIYTDRHSDEGQSQHLGKEGALIRYISGERGSTDEGQSQHLGKEGALIRYISGESGSTDQGQSLQDLGKEGALMRDRASIWGKREH